MKRRLSLAITLALALGPAAMADSLQDVVDKNLEARGGVDKIKSVQSAKVSATLSMGGQMEAPITLTWKRPDKLRIEITIQGMTAIQAFDGESAWSVSPFEGSTDPQPASADEAKILEEQADFLEGPLIDSADKGYTLEYEGEEEIEGTPAYKIKVTNKHGDVNHIFIDSEYFLEIRSEGKRSMRGQEIEFETTQGDYKDVGGIVFAHSIESHPKGSPTGQTLTINSIELDVDVPDSAFAMPEVEEPEAPEPAEQEESDEG